MTGTAGAGKAAKKTEGKAKGYSLDLAPSGEVRKKLAKIISSLAKKYRGPIFKPHVTLIGEIELDEKQMFSATEKLAKSLRPFKIILGAVDGEDEYFRCLFVCAQKTRGLVEANNKAREVFKRKRDPKYMPHLSLFYGKLPQKTKEEITAKLGRKFDVTFEAKSIRLFLTEGEPKDWRKLKEFHLK